MRTPSTLFAALLFATSTAHAATFTVTRADDPAGATCTAGDCSLRGAILAANTAAGADTIAFNVPPTTGSDVEIVLTSLLPPVTGDDTTINGYTQPGAIAPTFDITQFNGTIRVLVDGRGLSDPSGVGLTLAGNRIAVRGLALVGFRQAQVEVTGSSNLVVGNRIGTDLANRAAEPLPQLGVWLRRTGAAPIANHIGDADERNLISGVLLGVLADGIGAGQNLSEENRISNNHINLGANGIDYAFGGDGVEVRNSTNVRVGASNNTPFVSGNVIAGSPAPDRFGVMVKGGTRIFVEGNNIGGGAGFPFPVPYPVGTGILLRDGASFCFVQDNYIVATTGNGIELVDGTAATGTTRATITTNSVLSTGGLAIDLGADGLDANDALDADAGPNARQNAPTISNVVDQGANYVVTITHQGEPNTDYSFDLFAVPRPRGAGSLASAKGLDPDSFEAMLWLFAGFSPSVVRTDANGAGTTVATLLKQSLPAAALLTATATKNVFSGTPTTSERGRAASFAALPDGNLFVLEISPYRLQNLADARTGRIVHVRRIGSLAGTSSVTVTPAANTQVTPPPGGNMTPSWGPGDGSTRPYLVAYTGPAPGERQRYSYGMSLDNPVNGSLSIPSVYRAEVGDLVGFNGIPVYDTVFNGGFETPLPRQ